MRHDAMQSVLTVAEQTENEFEKQCGRRHGLIAPYQCEDAELILITSGTTSSTARLAADALRNQGVAAGAINVRLFRPFPGELLKSAIGGAAKVAVIDRNLCVGLGGIFAQELRAALYGTDTQPRIYGFVTGLGGGDITVESIKNMAQHTLENNTPANDAPIWWK
jgi:pyruvate/2-oxoacid:ferredoxin oxidoreductase alpha subunit